MNPADYGMTWQEVAKKRLAYIKRLQAELARLREREASQLRKYRVEALSKKAKEAENWGRNYER